MNEFYEVLLSQSFPIAVAVYLLVRLEAKLEALETSLYTLNKSIDILCFKNNSSIENEIDGK